MSSRPRSNACAAIALLLLLAACTSVDAADGCSVRSGVNTVPLVELYTSEGCSSCPPADRWFSRAAAARDVNWLAFHVDYWDAIGWPDRFASAAATRRQRERVNAVGQETVYTPQVMAGADVQAPWRTDRAFADVLRRARGPSKAGLALRVDGADDVVRARLGAARYAGAQGKARVWLAQYVDDQDTDVRAGENRGVHLHHDRVVTQLWGPWPLDAAPVSREQDLQPPRGKWGLVAFVQDASGVTWQSLALPGEACATMSR